MRNKRANRKQRGLVRRVMGAIRRFMRPGEWKNVGLASPGFRREEVRRRVLDELKQEPDIDVQDVTTEEDIKVGLLRVRVVFQPVDESTATI